MLIQPMWSAFLFYTQNLNVFINRAHDILFLQVMFNTAVHSEMIHEHKAYGFDVTFKSFNWR